MIADKLRQLRALKGVTQETAAEKIGISVRALAGYERGERIPRGVILASIADYYGVSREELLLDSLKEKELGECDTKREENGTETVGEKRRRNARPIIIVSAAIVLLLVVDTVLFIVENLPVENGASSIGIISDWRNLAMALLVLLLAALFVSGLILSLRHKSKLAKRMFAIMLAFSVACGVAAVTIGALLSKDAFFAGEARRGFVTYLRIDIQGDYNGNITAKVTNNFNLGFDTVQVRLDLYFSGTNTDNAEEMTAVQTVYSDDLDIYKSIEVSAAAESGYWKAVAVCKTNGSGWRELKTDTLLFNDSGVAEQ